MITINQNYIELRNKVKVPIIGLGTSLRGKPKIDNQTFIDSVKHAIDIGYRHIDTVAFKLFQMSLILIMLKLINFQNLILYLRQNVTTMSI